MPQAQGHFSEFVSKSQITLTIWDIIGGRKKNKRSLCQNSPVGWIKTVREVTVLTRAKKIKARLVWETVSAGHRKIRR